MYLFLGVVFFTSLSVGKASTTVSELLADRVVRCSNDSWVPPSAVVNTTQRLQQLRDIFKERNIAAYVISSNDEHQSEYVAEHDQRRGFISGFSGSAGEAVVTAERAALWTDSRYYLQAGEQLDCNWELMPTGEASTPSVANWLKKVLPQGAAISADPKTTSFNEWETLRKGLEQNNISLSVITENLVDLVWGEDQPPYPDEPLVVQDFKYTGQLTFSAIQDLSIGGSIGETWEDKIAKIRMVISKSDIDTFIMTSLDEIAWTLNLRGGDIPFTPVFRSYLIIQQNISTLYVPRDKITDSIEQHLNVNGTQGNETVRLKFYEEIWEDLEGIGTNSVKLGISKSYSYSQGVSYLIHSKLPANKTVELVSPALIFKDYKNDVEAEGMKTAHIKDAVALCVFFARLSADIIAHNKSWTEMSAVAALDQLRWQQPLTRGPSFATIAASGPNAALPHYEPSNETDLPITDYQVFLVDSGGQYLDGTTDVTRTVHFGNPREEEMTVYTHLLMGCIDMVTTVFPSGKTLSDLEIVLRRPLYSLGMDYGHGSTHGIGSLLSVHESFNTTFHMRFFGSQEPGYYKENDFGMRLENIVSVVAANPLSGATNYLTFEATTLVPYDRNLINTTQLERHHVEWLNEYNKKIREKVGHEMLQQGYSTEYDWLLIQTEPFES